MKTIKTILTAIIALLILVFGFLIGERVSNYRIPPGKVLVAKSFLDSINNLKPDTIIIDSVIYEDRIVYRDREIPVPVEVEPGLNFYSDSIIDDTTYLVINDIIRGELVNREIELKRAVILREINTPYPVIVEREIEVYSPPWSLYGNVITGGNQHRFMTGVGFGFINRSNTIIGGQILTDFDKNYFSVTIGRKFDF